MDQKSQKEEISGQNKSTNIDQKDDETKHENWNLRLGLD